MEIENCITLVLLVQKLCLIAQNVQLVNGYMLVYFSTHGNTFSYAFILKMLRLDNVNFEMITKYSSLIEKMQTKYQNDQPDNN